jgi:hypothetical protein
VRKPAPFVSIIIFVGFCACLSAWAQGTGKYQLIVPRVVKQNESFTGFVVEEKGGHKEPVSKGEQISFNGQVLDVEENGVIKFPSVTTLGDLAVNAALVTDSQSSSVHLEATPTISVLSTADNVSCKIFHASDSISPGGPVAVQGQGLNTITQASLIGTGGEQVPLGPSAGSSLERFFLPVNSASIPKGTYTVNATDGGGNIIAAPNTTLNPHLKISGTPVQKRGQRGELVLQSEASGSISLTGGSPQITLDKTSVKVAANVPTKVGFVANEVGPYNLQTRFNAQENPEQVKDSLKDKLREEEEKQKNAHPRTRDKDRPGEGRKDDPAGQEKERERIPLGPVVQLPKASHPQTETKRKKKLGIYLHRTSATDERWIPENGNMTSVTAEIYTFDYDKSKWLRKGDQKKITFEFSERSKEVGECLNSGSEKTPDLHFMTLAMENLDNLNPNHSGKVRTREETDVWHVSITSNDFGSFGKVFATAPECVSLNKLSNGELVEAPNAVAVPRDDNNNQIADQHEKLEGMTPLATDDKDDTPEGNGVLGDGLSAYEEYRGFRVMGKHRRTDWGIKDLFIYDQLGFGYELFEQQSYFECWSILPQEFVSVTEKVINANHGHAYLGYPQHGLHLVNARLREGIRGQSIIGPPKKVTSVEVDFYKVFNSCVVRPVPKVWETKDYKEFFETQESAKEFNEQVQSEVQGTIAHELGHATGLQHHGNWFDAKLDGNEMLVAPTSYKEKLKSNSADKILFTDKHIYYDGHVATYNELLPSKLYVGVKHNNKSGDEECIMRYENPFNAIYENEDGSFELINDFGEQKYFCETKHGHSFNKGNSGASFALHGNCKHQFIVNDK